MAAWNNPLRLLSPLSEHPTASPSLSPALSDTSVAFLGASVKLDKIKQDHYGAWRILSAFFEHLDFAGKCNLTADMEQCNGDDQLVGLSNHLLDAILKPCLPVNVAGGQSPEPLSTPPSEGAEDAIDAGMSTINASTRAEQAVLRAECLRRDGYRCVFTGTWDFNSVDKGMAMPPPDYEAGPVECAHIIPFALGTFDDGDAVQTRNKTIIWFSIHRYFPELKDLIDARSINQCGNVVTMDLPTHRNFGSYIVAFQPQGDNKYVATRLVDVNVRTTSKTGSAVFSLASADDQIPMPNQEFFKVHFIISRILQTSDEEEKEA
ncbi:hypothetical protein SPBR_08483 [Sporothrix brasiliensis 5110]|uniref:HNH nuclease domain-containing protein n=1 Tax=Sporothrix brasiliensis 5110 TaxID=1398154 RepID=A0A0C2IN19_9PEZI|nr:uncharacterized protein SPBR_08483 [Sporothrix brasiliensis 5110]KIH86392.1 hypothetical protein SPBR_08483 [Sporothrix brasiliensis 5110]